MNFTNFWDSSGSAGGNPPSPIDPIPGDVFALRDATTTPVAYNMPAGVTALQSFWSVTDNGQLALGDDGKVYVSYGAEGAGGDFTVYQDTATPENPYVASYNSYAASIYGPEQGMINQDGSVTVQWGTAPANNYPDSSVSPIISNEQQWYAYGNLTVYNVNGEAQGYIMGRYGDGARPWYYAQNETWANSPAATQNYQWTLDQGDFPVSLSCGMTAATCLSNNGTIYYADQAPGSDQGCSNWTGKTSAANDAPYKIPDSATGGSTVNFIDVVCGQSSVAPLALFLARDDQNNLWGALNQFDFQIYDTDVVSIGPPGGFGNSNWPYLKSDGTVRWINTADQTITDSNAAVQSIFDNGNFTGWPRFFCTNEFITMIIPQ